MVKRPRFVVMWFLGWALACGPAPDEQHPPGPGAPGAALPVVAARPEPDRRPRHDMMDSLRADLAATRHPRDGVGHAWLADSWPTETVSVSASGRWRLVYEAAGEGIAPGGMLFFQVSPFWGWSTPQTDAPTRPGYTRVSTQADGVVLEARTLDQQLLGIGITGRTLRAGERVEIDYGAGVAGARADRFAERGSRFWLAVDGDGDGVRKLIADSPAVVVAPGPPARLVPTLTSTARPGQVVRLTVAVVDAVGNGDVPFTGPVALTPTPPFPGLPETLDFVLEDRGARTLELTASVPGIYRVEATGLGQGAISNPLHVSDDGARLVWGDLQNHSNLSDGTARPTDLLRYARDIAALDVVSLTDHDHWGLRFLDQSPDLWREIAAETRRFHEPTRFVTVPGFEWTDWISGHRHVLFFDGEAELLSVLDPRYDTPTKLWAALDGRRAITIAHHSAGGPIATDWSIAPDPRFEPVTEIVSVHGASEAMDAPTPIYRPVPGNFVRDALDRGHRLGFLGSSDGHDGHPGLGHLAAPSGGLAAIFTEDLTREGVYEALMARRVYATNGPRIVLRASLGGHRMGAEIPIVGDELAPGAIAGIAPGVLVVQAWGVTALERLDVIRSGEVLGAIDCDGGLDCSASLVLNGLAAGEYVYVRAIQRDGGAAWSSPWFVVAPGEA